MEDSNRHAVGEVIDTVESATNRIVMRSDGKFASKEFWVVVNDLVGVETKTDSDIYERLDKLMGAPRVNGDNMFDKLKDSELKSQQSAKNSARGYGTRYAHGPKPLKNWNRIRNIENYSYHNGEEYSFSETGGFMPIRVKAIALPESPLANQCNSYSEYKMKCELMGLKEYMSERDFTVYKY